MKKISCFLIGICFFLPVSCQNNDKDPNFPVNEKVIKLSAESMEMVSSDNSFGIDIFKRILLADPDKNLMVSPLSISQALLMTYNGADGDTKKAFEQTLYLAGLTTDQINRAQKDLVTALLEVDPGVIIDIANSIWIKENFSVKPEFISVNNNYYDAEVNQLIFDESAIKQINNWVNDKTNKKIEKIIEEIYPMTIMFLINAVYFNGNWKYKFDESNTRDQDFNLTKNDKITIPFMNQTTKARLMHQNNFKALELPYGRGNFSMLFFLPEKSKTISDILDVWDNDSYNQWLNEFAETNVDISIPKFKFAYEKELNDVLKAMNLSLAFDPVNANFTKINAQVQLYISKVKHKSFIDVNEKGTEAAAVTSVEVRFTSIEEPVNPKFVADRPFLFVIREKYTNAIVFMGKVMNPSKD